MTALRTKTRGEMNEESFEFLARNTDGRVSMLEPGGIARALVESMNIHLEGFYDSLDLNYTMSFATLATGKYLDLIGALVGVSRRPARAAAISATDRAIKFYVNTGTLYDRLPKAGNKNQGLVPAGTTVTSSDGGVLYTVEEDTTFPRTAKEVFVSASASSTGDRSNVGAFQLTTHSLNVDGVFVTNPTTISTGRDIEPDTEFRARILSRVRATEGANETNIRLIALSAPGVADVRITPFLVGPGTYDVLLVPTGNRIALEALDTVVGRIRDQNPLGVFFRVREPDYVRFSTVIKLGFLPSVLESEKDVIRHKVETAVLNYVGNIPLGQSFVLTAMGAAIKNADSRVYDYSIAGLCINGRAQILQNWQLAPDEVFLPDENLQDPIRVI